MGRTACCSSAMAAPGERPPSGAFGASVWPPLPFLSSPQRPSDAPMRLSLRCSTPRRPTGWRARSVEPSTCRPDASRWAGARTSTAAPLQATAPARLEGSLCMAALVTRTAPSRLAARWRPGPNSSAGWWWPHTLTRPILRGTATPVGAACSRATHGPCSRTTPWTPSRSRASAASGRRWRRGTPTTTVRSLSELGRRSSQKAATWRARGR
mmetsp:Transcript_107117/g.299886  ORF Transcript_107117/g.299886 Transcript_107117/m.299886 type:complete len:211 (+) Transcript_107117:128-760(+)